MAFPKAKTKRFNEVTTCAPPPGYYDPQIKSHLPGAAFQRTERFRPLARETEEEFMVSNVSSSSTPFKRIYVAPLKYRRRSSSLNNLSIPMNMVSSHASMKLEEVICTLQYNMEMKSERKNKQQNSIRKEKPEKKLSDINLDSKINIGGKKILKGENVHYISKIAKLQEHVKDNESHLQIAYASISSLKDEIKSLKDKLYIYEEKEKDYLANEEIVLNEKKHIEKSLIKLRDQCYKEILNLNEEREKQNVTVLHLKELAQNMNKDANLISEQFKESLSQLQLLDSKVEKLSQDKSVIELELKQKDAIYKEEYKEIKYYISDYETTISNLTTEMCALRLQYENALTVREDQTKALEKTILIQNEQLANLKVKLKEQEEVFNKINNTLLEKQELEKDGTISQLKEDNSALIEGSQKLKDKNVEVESKLESFIQKLEQVVFLNGKLKSENLSLLKNLEKCTTENENNCSVIEKFQKRLNTLEQTVAENAHQFKGIQQEKKTLEENKYNLENTLSEKIEEICKLKIEYGEALLELSVFQDNTKELNSCLQKLQTEKEQDVKHELELQKESENYKCQLEKLNTILHKNTQEIATLKGKEKLMYSETTLLKECLESAKEEKMALESIVDQLTDEKENLLHQMNKTEKEQDVKHKLELQKESESYKCQLEKLNTILHKNKQEVATLKGKEKLMYSEITSLKECLESAKEEKKALGSIVDQLTDEKENLLHQMNKTEKEQDVKHKLELQKESESYKCQLEKLNTILHKNKQEVATLKGKEKLMYSEITSLKECLKSAKEEKKALGSIVDQLTDEKENLLHQMNNNKVEAENRLQEEINQNCDFKKCIELQLKLLEGNTEEQKEMLLSELAESHLKLAALEMEYSQCKLEMKNEVADLYEKLQFQEKLYKEKIYFLEELRQEIPVELIEEIECLKLEKNKWEKLFKNLESKIAPFKEHLDAYEMERNLLLSKNSETQLELQNLSEEYVKLLGHQNHKQKIRHVMKLKDENFNLKKEINQLKERNLKQKKAMFCLEEELNHFRKRKNLNNQTDKNKENERL